MRGAWVLLSWVAISMVFPAPDDVRTLSHPASVGYDAAQLRDAYALGGLDGAGVRVAIVTWGPADESAFDAYADANGLPSSNLTHHGDCSGGTIDEWNLDTQMVRAAAPLAEIHVYCASGPNFTELRGALDAAIADGMDVLSVSWGSCEARVPDAVADAYAWTFANASAAGVAVFAASGDGGSRECTRWGDEETIATSWPAVDPRVLAVGGTRLELAEGAWNETAWNTCAPCPGTEWSASGGGTSLRAANPYWLPEGARGSPDVAAVGDRATGVEVFSEGAWKAMGGTSASAPFWAGVWAGMLSELGTGPLGDPGPLLVQAVAAFRDITVGSNGDHVAGTGRDLVTGWGAPNGTALLDALALLPPAPQGLTTTRGPAPGEITLAWDAPAGAPQIVVLRGARAGNETPIATVASGASTFVDAGLGDGAAAWYRIAAKDAVTLLSGPAGAPVLGLTFASPSPPRDLTAFPGLGAVRLAWRASADDGGLPLSYDVVRDGAAIATVGALAFDDAGCPPLTLCKYVVVARNDVGPSPPSNEAAMLGLPAGPQP